MQLLAITWASWQFICDIVCWRVDIVRHGFFNSRVSASSSVQSQQIVQDLRKIIHKIVEQALSFLIKVCPFELCFIRLQNLRIYMICLC